MIGNFVIDTVMDLMDNDSDNKGATNAGRGVIALSTGLTGLLIATTAVVWPANLAWSNVWGPVVVMALSGIGGYLSVRIRKTPTELACEEFGDLGLTTNDIVTAVLLPREKASKLVAWAATSISDSDIRGTLEDISEIVFTIIDGFKKDPSDAARSRHVLKTCLDQAKKIGDNYYVVSTGAGASDDTTAQTRKGLKQIYDALEEQHRRNMDNNTAALEVDLNVSDQLLQHLTKG